MVGCSHNDGRGGSCGNPALPGQERCLWHHPRAAKDQAYVADLLRHHLAGGGGGADYHLRGLLWPGAALSRCRLLRADLRECVLPRAVALGIDLEGANLRRANLRGADLRDANLCRCDLTDADLGGADLRGADLSGAMIDGTSLLACDLRGANCKGVRWRRFIWNRATRLVGATDLDLSETVSFNARDNQPGTGYLRQLGPIDPAIEATRRYGSDDSGDVTVTMSSDQQHMMQEQGRSSAQRPATRRPRALGPWRIAAGLLLLWALAATTVAVAELGQDWLPASSAPGPGPSSGSAIDAAAERARVAELETSISEYRTQIAELNARLDRLRSDRTTSAERCQALLEREQELRVQLGRLRTVDDRADLLTVENNDLKRRLKELQATTRRQRDTSAIIAAALDELEADNNRLRELNDQHLLELDANQTLRKRLAELNQERSTNLALIATQKTKIEELSGQLQDTQSNLQRFLTRIEGTQLEALLDPESSGRGPLLAVSPGKSIALGGSALVSLRIDHGESEGTIRVELALQPTGTAPIPEISTILYDAQGEALRRLSFSFPEHQAGQRLAMATTVISCATFPATARVSVARAVK